MSLPPVIPIAHEPDYRTASIGRYAEGQFYAAIQGAHRDNDREPDRERARIRWYTYIHLFDHDGRHRGSQVELIGVAPTLHGDFRERAEDTLSNMLTSLQDRKFGDIAIRPFWLEHDGVTFGLFDESSPERGGWAELYPDRLGFHEPWDGLYDT